MKQTRTSRRTRHALTDQGANGATSDDAATSNGATSGGPSEDDYDTNWTAQLRPGAYGLPPVVKIGYQALAPPNALFDALRGLGWVVPSPGPPPKNAIDWSTPDPQTGERYTIRPWTSEISLQAGTWQPEDIDHVTAQTQVLLDENPTLRAATQRFSESHQQLRGVDAAAPSHPGVLVLAPQAVCDLWTDRSRGLPLRSHAVVTSEHVPATAQSLSVDEQLRWLEIEHDDPTTLLQDPNARPLFGSGWVLELHRSDLHARVAGEQLVTLLLRLPQPSLLSRLANAEPDRISVQSLSAVTAGYLLPATTPEYVMVQALTESSRSLALVAGLISRSAAGYWRHKAQP